MVDANVWLQAAIGPVSIICCVWICVAYCRLPAKKQSTNLGLVAALAASNGAFALKFLLTGLQALVTGQPPGAASLTDVPLSCRLLAALGQLSGMFSLAYSVAIAVNLWCTLAAPLTYRASKYKRWLHGVPCVASIGTTAAGYALDLYGPAGDASCWITAEHTGYRLAFFFIPLYVGGMVAIAAVARLAFAMRDRPTSSTGGARRSAGSAANRSRRRSVQRAGAFVAAFLFSWAGESLLRMWELSGAGTPAGLVVFCTATNTVKGVLDAIIWSNSMGARPKPSSDGARGRYMQLRG